jgi:hypothetical protein
MPAVNVTHEDRVPQVSISNSKAKYYFERSEIHVALGLDGRIVRDHGVRRSIGAKT